MVRFEDAYGNLGAMSTSDQTIGLGTTSSAGAFYAGATGGNAITSIPITAGLSSATVYYSDTQAGSPTVTVSDTAFSSSVNQGETIVPAAADQFVVTTSFASPDAAGAAGSVTVTAKDPYGNTAGSGPDQYEGTVDLTSTDGRVGGLPSSYLFTALDAGSHIFTAVVLETAGNQTITATDSVTSSVDGTSPAVDVIPTAASQVAITSAPLTLVAGSTGQLTVQLEDPYGNTGATSTTAQTIGLSTTSAAGAFYASQTSTTPITSVVIPAGKSTLTFAYGDTKAGTPTITASDPALSSAPTQKETVVPAAADHFTVTTSFTSPDVAGTAGTVTLTAYDAYNNRVGSGPDQYEGTVNLTGSDGRLAGLPSSYTFTAGDAGSHTFTNVIMKTAGSQSITATDSVRGAITGHTSVAVTSAAATQLVFTTPPRSDRVWAGVHRGRLGRRPLRQRGHVLRRQRDDHAARSTACHRHRAGTERRGDVPQPHARRNRAGRLDSGERRRIDRRIDGPRIGERRLDLAGRWLNLAGRRLNLAGRRLERAGQRLLADPTDPDDHRRAGRDVPEKEQEGQAGGQGRAARLHA